MIPLRDNQINKHVPYVTYALIFANCIIYLWDRQWHLFGPNVVFADLALTPKELVQGIKGLGDRFAIVTLFTSMFLHGSLMHLVGNMLFLLTFGHGVEEALGSWRFAVYYLGWGIAASFAHVFVDPSSPTSTLGASGAIGGVLGCYLLLFPSNRIQLLIPYIFFPVVVSAWLLLGVWFLWQVFVPQQGVATWAHVGGFLAGMLTVLIAGGRQAVLKDRPLEFDQNFDD